MAAVPHGRDCSAAHMGRSFACLGRQLVKRKALLHSNVTSEDWSSRKIIENLTPVAMPDMSQLIWQHQPYPQEDWQGKTARIQDPHHFSKQGAAAVSMMLHLARIAHTMYYTST